MIVSDNVFQITSKACACIYEYSCGFSSALGNVLLMKERSESSCYSVQRKDIYIFDIALFILLCYGM